MSQQKETTRIETTADGSATLFVPALEEHYHSVKGARTESLHVFVETGLRACAATAPRVLEVGFGTGLNAWLTLLEAERSAQTVHYTGIELHPLPWSTVQQLGYAEADARFRNLHEAAWGTEVELSPHFRLTKVHADVLQWCMNTENRPDVIYFDAFAPEKQPEMWTQPLFDRLFRLLRPGGVLATYCAKGVVRRMLLAAGFAVERLPGPPGGKREILRARKPATSTEKEIPT